jgi:hypothetical protein
MARAGSRREWDMVERYRQANIEFEWDLVKRTGKFSVENILGAIIEPIKNPVTGADHHASIHLKDGFEFREAEMASSSFWSKGELVQKHEGRFTAMSYVTYGPHGIIDQESHPVARP